ncbi:MAG TPA: PP2C family protein-serine/threonine phosphatase [Terracidiphilus sp.]|nr:PP2C family protein-serine/threonine phosphatase [Terracidiphilus sp.]
MRLRSLLLFLIFLSRTFCASAQSFDMEKDGVRMVDLTGLWRFQTGDDPDGKLGWANPGFDDSKWALLRSDRTWKTQGYMGYGGMAWYRFQVVLPEHHDPLALLIPIFMTSFQVFAGGRLIGQYGGLPPHEEIVRGSYAVLLRIPADVIVPGKPLQIAIRVWHSPYLANLFGGGPYLGAQIGEAKFLEQYKDLVATSFVWSNSAINLLLVINLLAGIAALGLFALQTSDREYLWFAIFEMLNGASLALGDIELYRVHPYKLLNTLENCAQMAGLLVFLVFLFKLLHQRRDLLYRLAISSALLGPLLLFPLELEWFSASVSIALLVISFLPYFAAVLALLVKGARIGNRDAALLLCPFGLSYGAYTLDGVFQSINSSGHGSHLLFNRSRWFYDVSDWPFSFSVQNIADALLQLSVLAILVLRFARTRRDEQRLASELEAARAVQQVLIPEEIPAIPGYQIECVYRPAGEVGGDFFQILLLPSGDALVVVGDVSGKGMPAAMTVSLLVGTLRTAAESTTSPSAILKTLNRRLLGRSSGGFTTCLVLRIEPSGVSTAANAGHIAPYVNGKEQRIENGLPLGLTEGVPYAESTFQLGPEDQITLLTDGVVEARNSSHELFGFDRVAAMATDSATEIAAAAQAFGQEDDITVLKLTRQTGGEQAVTVVEPPAWTPAPA